MMMSSDDTTPGAGQEEQLSMWDEAAGDAVAEESERAAGVFSGIQMRASRPDEYRQIQQMLVEGVLSQRQIARLTRHSRNLIAVISRELLASPGAMEPYKQGLAAQAAQIARVSGERIMEVLLDPSSKPGLRELGVVHGIAVDKLQVLTGAPTSIVGDAQQPGADVDDYLVTISRRRMRVGGENRVVKEAEGVVVGPARAVGAEGAGGLGGADERTEAVGNQEVSHD